MVSDTLIQIEAPTSKRLIHLTKERPKANRSYTKRPKAFTDNDILSNEHLYLDTTPKKKLVSYDTTEIIELKKLKINNGKRKYPPIVSPKPVKKITEKFEQSSTTCAVKTNESNIKRASSKPISKINEELFRSKFGSLVNSRKVKFEMNDKNNKGQNVIKKKEAKTSNVFTENHSIKGDTDTRANSLYNKTGNNTEPRKLDAELETGQSNFKRDNKLLGSQIKNLPAGESVTEIPKARFHNSDRKLKETDTEKETKKLNLSNKTETLSAGLENDEISKDKEEIYVEERLKRDELKKDLHETNLKENNYKETNETLAELTKNVESKTSNIEQPITEGNGLLIKTSVFKKSKNSEHQKSTQAQLIEEWNNKENGKPKTKENKKQSENLKDKSKRLSSSFLKKIKKSSDKNTDAVYNEKLKRREISRQIQNIRPVETKQYDPDEMTNHIIGENDNNESEADTKNKKRISLKKRILSQLSFEKEIDNQKCVVGVEVDKTIKDKTITQSHLPGSRAELMTYKEIDETDETQEKEIDNTLNNIKEDIEKPNKEAVKKSSKLRCSFRKLSDSMITPFRQSLNDLRTKSLYSLRTQSMATLNEPEKPLNKTYIDPDEQTNQMLCEELQKLNNELNENDVTESIENNNVKTNEETGEIEILNQQLPNLPFTHYDKEIHEQPFNNQIIDPLENNNQPKFMKPLIITTHNDISSFKTKTKNLPTKLDLFNQKNQCYSLNDNQPDVVKDATTFPSNNDIINEIVNQSDKTSVISSNEILPLQTNKFENDVKILRRNIEDLNEFDKHVEKAKLNDMNYFTERNSSHLSDQNALVSMTSEICKNNNMDIDVNNYIENNFQTELNEPITNKKRDSMKSFLINKMYARKTSFSSRKTFNVNTASEQYKTSNNTLPDKDIISPYKESISPYKEIILPRKENNEDLLSESMKTPQRTLTVSSSKSNYFTPTVIRKSYFVADFTPNPVRRRVDSTGKLLSKEESSKNNLIRSLSITMSKNNVQF